MTEAGTYYITCGGLDQSYSFTIGNNVYDSLLDDSVKMLYLQRCGTEVKDSTFGHVACHNTLATVYHTNEKSMSAAAGMMPATTADMLFPVQSLWQTC